MDSSKKRCPFCCLGIFTWTTPATHTVEACARARPRSLLHAGPLEPGVALALAAAQRGSAPVENELSSAVAGPARTAVPRRRRVGRSRGTRGRSRSLLVRFVDRRCVLVQLLLSRNEPQGRRRALLAFRCEVNEYVTRGFAVFATICSEGTIRRFGPEEEEEGFES